MANRRRRCHPEGGCRWHLRRRLSSSLRRRALADPPTVRYAVLETGAIMDYGEPRRTKERGVDPLLVPTRYSPWPCRYVDGPPQPLRRTSAAASDTLAQHRCSSTARRLRCAPHAAGCSASTLRLYPLLCQSLRALSNLLRDALTLALAPSQPHSRRVMPGHTYGMCVLVNLWARSRTFINLKKSRKKG